MQVRTLCRSCSAACGILVEVERRSGAGEDRVLSVRGDPANPRSHGYLCPKGAALPEFHHRSSRLEHPRLRGERASWRAVLDDLASTLTRLRLDPGSDAIALYQGTGAVSDSLGVAAIGRFMTSLGSTQFYTAATVDVAPALRAAEMVVGFYQPWPVWVPEDSKNRLALLFGFNPALSHGYLTMLPDATERLRAHRARGGELWVVDPRRTRTARLADHHLAIRPGTDALLLAWLLRDALANDRPAPAVRSADRAALASALAPLTLQQVVNETGLAAVDVEALTTAIRRAGRIAVLPGTGITLGADALLCEWLRWALLAVTDSLDREGGMWFNPGVLTRLEETGLALAPPEGRVAPGPRARPELARVLDQNPCVALVDEIEAGNVRALFVAGSSPLTSFPEPERLRRALSRLEALVALDIVETPLTEIASHVLPTTGQLERADLVLETQAAYAPAVVPAVAERKPMEWIFEQVGRRMDLEGGTDARELDGTREEVLVARMAATARGGADALLAAGPDGVGPPRTYGWVHERVLPQLPDGCFRLLPDGLLARLADRIARPPSSRNLMLVAARQLTRTNSTAYVSPRKSRDRPLLHLHPDDAAASGLSDGARVEIESASGAVTAQVAIDVDLSPGVATLAHGWFDANVCALTSSRDRIDPLTGQPPMTAIAIRLRAP